METVLDQLSAHPFLSGMPAPWVERLSHEARRVVHHGGSRLFHEGHPAERFWLIREGRIAVDFPVPGRGDVVIDHLGPGSVLGWSWRFEPYRWHFGAVAAELTTALQFDAAGVRRICADDPALGQDLALRFAGVLGARLQAAQIRLLDLYSYPGTPVPHA